MGSRVVQVCQACADGHGPARAATAEDWPEGRERGDAVWGWRRYAAAGALVSALALVTWQARPYVPARTAAADSLTPGKARPAAIGHGHPGSSVVPAPKAPEKIGGPVHGVAALEGEEEEDGGEILEIEDPEDIALPAELPPTVEDVLEDGEEPLHERLPTLADWVFPVQGSDEGFPLKQTRRFGAVREGVGRSECGQGHCGVDLDGPRGSTVVAVAWGVVTRIERRGNGRSGKYVRIEHPDYVYTSYMHLDEIAEGLEVGDEIDAGAPLGTLGRTGILHSAPHLHFSLEVPGGGRLMHLDPTPYLVDAARSPEP